MKRFGYAVATEAAQVPAALADPATRILAGGTEMLNWIRLGIASPARLLDVGRLPSQEITAEATVLRIPSSATLSAIGEHPLVTRHAALLAEACLKAASPQIRNRATIGGNLLQKTRCAYFRAEEPLPWGCNKRIPSSGCSARTGIDDDAAIFDWTDGCVAIQPSDPAVALSCLDAHVEILGPRGFRSLPMTDFHLTQQQARAEGLDEARSENRLARDDFITGLRVPFARGGSSYIKVRERESYAYAIATAAAIVEVNDAKILACRLALGSVAQRPWRLRDVERSLVGQPLERVAIATIVSEAMRAARAVGNNTSKILIATGAAVRAVLTAGGAR